MQERSILWSFSLPAALSAAMVGPIHWVCATLLVGQPGGYDQMGMFSAADQWQAVLLFLPNMLGVAMLPVLSGSVDSRNAAESRATLKLSLKMDAMLVLPPVILISLISPYVMRLYGADYVSAWPILVVALLTAGLVAIQMPFAKIIVASGRMWLGFAMNSGWALVFVGMTHLLIGMGALGMASARLAAYGLHTLWVLAFGYFFLRDCRRGQLVNINTKEYWDTRFATGDWDEKRGREQTTLFAQAQIRHFDIPREFSGRILDFGCGLGDAMPIYRRAYPHASLIGMDISDIAVKKCRETYGHIASFLVGTPAQVPEVDVIIASNVLEHISDDLETAEHLLKRCQHLYVTVPYREDICTRWHEHVHWYDENSFKSLCPHKWEVFPCRGYSQYGWRLCYEVYFKNVLRVLLGKKMHRRSRQIVFCFYRCDRLR